MTDTPASSPEKKPPKKAWAWTTAKLASSFLALGILVDFWRTETLEDFAGGLGGNRPDAALVTTPDKIKRAAPEIKNALLANCEAYSIEADNNGVAAVSPEEWPWELIKDKVDDFQILESYHSPEALGTLHAVAFKQKSSGKILVACAGMQTGHPARLPAGMYGGFRSTTGDVDITGLNHFKTFIDQVRRKHGKIDMVCGHSLGAVMACAIKPYLEKDTALFVFDCPGITHTMTEILAEQYGKSKKEILDCFKQENVYSLVIGRNAYNRLGTQPGQPSTLTPPEEENLSYLAPIPLHHRAGAFAAEIDTLEQKIQPDDGQGISTGPAFYTLFLSMVLVAANFSHIKPRLKKKETPAAER